MGGQRVCGEVNVEGDQGEVRPPKGQIMITSRCRGITHGSYCGKVRRARDRWAIYSLLGNTTVTVGFEYCAKISLHCRYEND